MNSKYLWVVMGCLLSFSWQATGHAVSDSQFASIQRLGALNGIALQCKALDETRRMKQALVANLPKRRQLGELFDQETHRSFLEFIDQQAGCPSPATLAKMIDDAIKELEAAFSSE